MASEVLVDDKENIRVSLVAGEGRGPCSSGVQDVPGRAAACAPAGARIVVAETVNRDVPERLIVRYEKVFG